MKPLRTLPKAHLHLHLTAAMRPRTCAELARRDGIELPPAAQAWASFGAFAASYHGAGAVLRYPQDLRRLVREMVEDARDDGAVWVEPQTTLVSYRAITGSDEATLELLLDAAADAAARTGVGVGLVISATREHDPAEAVRVARLASRYAEHGVVGFGLGGDERHSPELFAGSFAIAREAGLLKVPHAGEFSGPRSVRGALDALGADRIQHGIRAAEDADLLTQLARDGTCLDVCPSSNVALGITSWDRHPLPELLAKGVACSVNADGPLLFRTSLLGEYEACRDRLRLNDHQLAQIALTSILASTAPPATKARARTAIAGWEG